MVSAVDELAAQIKLEFDFEREALVMDSISKHLQVGLSNNDQYPGCKNGNCDCALNGSTEGGEGKSRLTLTANVMKLPDGVKCVLSRQFGRKKVGCKGSHGAGQSA